MDYTKPIATRTRGRYDQMYKKIHEEIKRKDQSKPTRSGSQSDSATVEEIEKGAFDHLDGLPETGCKSNNVIRIDESDDEVVFEYVIDKGEVMDGKPFVYIDDDGDHENDLDGNEVRGSKGFNFVEVKTEYVENESVTGFGFMGGKNGDVQSFDENGVMNSDGRESSEADGSRSQLRYEGSEDDNGASEEDLEESEESSSEDEEDNDDPDDVDYNLEDSEQGKEASSGEQGEDNDNDCEQGDNEGIEVITSGEEEEEERDEEEESEKEIGGRGKQKRFDCGLKRKTVLEMETSTHSKKAKNDGNGNKEDEKKMKGTTQNPIYVDEMELSYDSDDDYNDFDDDNANRSDDIGETSLRNEWEEAEGSGNDEDSDESYDAGQRSRSKNGKFGGRGGTANRHPGDLYGRKTTKRKRVRGLKDHEVMRILANSILENEEVPLEENNESINRPTLPLVFTFGGEKSPPPEKTEEEKQEEALWAEMSAALYESVHDCDAAHNAKVNNEADVVSPAADLDQASLCALGDHDWFLNEEIGLMCRFCSYVKTEIKHYVAPMSKNPWGRPKRRDYDYARSGNNILNQLDHHDSGSDLQHCFDPCVTEKGTVWDIIPGIGRGMHSHQRQGFEFLWKIIAGSIYIDKVKEKTSNGGNGCVISHAPGTGKTRLTIAFLQSYMKLYPMCRPVIIAPPNMLLNWEAEFQKWRVDIPFHNLNDADFSGKESKAAVDIWKRVKTGPSPTSSRMVKLYSWKMEKSILGISYGLFREFVGEGSKKSVKELQESGMEDHMRKVLLELPGLIILDEGHRPRNDQSLIWKALFKVQTEKRIILSGTPFQNNLDELFNTLCLVRPKFGDSISSQSQGAFLKKRGRKRNAARKNWADLTSPIGKLADDRFESERLEKLRELIAPFVHVHRGTILQKQLPGLRDSVVILQPENLQKCLLDGVQKVNGHLNFEHALSLASVHPSLLVCKKSLGTENIAIDWAEVESLRLDPGSGIKTKFLMELIRLSELWKEKVLVFSQYLEPLKLIMEQLESQFPWVQDKEILFMHGTVSAQQRYSLIKKFNNSSKAKVLLASTRACGEGISLVGASRVVLLDVVWNPSVERQAISRAYRLGQEKVVYVYHLIASETIEEDKYCRQAKKEQLSELVFYSVERSGSHQKISSHVSDDKKDRILEQMVDCARLKNIFKKIIYQPKESNLVELFGLGAGTSAE